MKRTVSMALVTLALVACQGDKKTSKPATDDVAKAAPATKTALPTKTAAPARGPAAASPTLPAKTAAPTGGSTIPGSDRAFMLDLDGDGFVELLGADGNALWALSLESKKILWRVEGPGVAHRLAVGDYGRGRALYVGWGVGRGFLGADMVLQRLDPATGKGETLWQYAGNPANPREKRAEPAHLSVVDVDGDGAKDLAFAHYVSKYMVGARHLKADGGVIEGAPLRMASSRAYGDVTGDGQTEEIIGRVYGDAKGIPGDLRVAARGKVTMVPTDNGVRSVLAGMTEDGKGKALYFSDGWVSNYGKLAKAQLKQAIWQGGKPVVKTIGTSADEFTFFDLESVDLDGDGVPEIIARGNKRVSAFRFDGQSWTRRTLADVPPVLNTALGKTKSGWKVAIPVRPATRIVDVAAK